MPQIVSINICSDDEILNTEHQEVANNEDELLAIISKLSKNPLDYIDEDWHEDLEDEDDPTNYKIVIEFED